jgi:hypothetical protein
LARPGSTWPGSTWPGSTWPGSTWPGSTWPGSTWPGSTWPGLVGLNRSGPARPARPARLGPASLARPARLGPLGPARPARLGPPGSLGPARLGSLGSARLGPPGSARLARLARLGQAGLARLARSARLGPLGSLGPGPLAARPSNSTARLSAQPPGPIRSLGLTRSTWSGPVRLACLVRPPGSAAWPAPLGSDRSTSPDLLGLARSTRLGLPAWLGDPPARPDLVPGRRDARQPLRAGPTTR